MALNPGDTLSNRHYRITRQLGRGGFGFVYLAQDTLLGEEVAIKELIPALVGDEATLRRFLAEAKATMRLTHRHIVRTHNVFQEARSAGDSRFYIVMEYMAGGSLEERLRATGPLPLEAAVRMAAEVCQGLGCAHEEGVVHCDLKPANILFDARGQAKVADFGIAHVSGEMLTRTWHTPAGFVAGTLPYMSPEQAEGVRDDPRVDVYALGAVLYRALTGRPYLDFDQRETPAAQADNVYRIRNQQPLPPKAHNRRVPDWLNGVVLKALAKKPEQRYVGVAAMQVALEQGRQPVPVEPTPAPSPPRPTPHPPRKTPPAPVTPTTPAPDGKAPPGAKRRAPRSRWVVPLAAAAGVVIVVLIVATGLMTLTPRPGEDRTRSKDGMAMVYVEAGNFLMGSSHGSGDEQPVRNVTLDAFWIDRTEVSNARYRKCVEAGACEAPAICVAGEPAYSDGSKAAHPVVCVNWSQAGAYCRWAGARLPTEAEWEKAARGGDGRTYPWGNDYPDCTKAQIRDCAEGTMPVGSRPTGASPYGTLDMAGSVWEWVNDWYDEDYYGRSPLDNPKGPDSGSDRVLRGGSWYSDRSSVRSANRDYAAPSSRSFDAGFRCADSR